MACDRIDLWKGLGLDRGGVIRNRGRGLIEEAWPEKDRPPGGRGLVEGRGLGRASPAGRRLRMRVALFSPGLSRVFPRCLGFPGGMAEPDELAWLAENGFAEDDAPPGEP